jgi:5-methylthioadenosine/S-adenosylhomocysteine deaminase
MSDPELCLRGGTIVTCDSKDRVLRGDVAIRGGKIVGVGRVRTPRGARSIDVSGKIVLPGLVLTHVHLCQALMRGMSAALAWLAERIWPLEAAHDELAARQRELGLSECCWHDGDPGSGHGAPPRWSSTLACAPNARFRRQDLMDSGAGVPRGLRETTRQALRCRAPRTGLVESSVWTRPTCGSRFILSCSEKLIRGAIERVAQLARCFRTLPST